MKRYRIEIAYGTYFHEFASLTCKDDANSIAEIAASSEDVKEVRIVEIETTETELRRFSISENAEAEASPDEL